MKYIAFLMLTLMLASCGTNNEMETEKTSTGDVVVEKTTNDLDEALDTIPDSADVTMSDIVKVDANYNNPQQMVDMQVSYSLDTDGKISMIEVSASNWDLSDFNTAVQSVVGKTLEEASNITVAGSSFTGEAFQNALKAQ